MPVDDILALDELTDDGAPNPRGRGRSSWIVFAALGFACVFVVVEIFANLGIKDSIGHAEQTLTVAQAAAGRVSAADGDLNGADPTRMEAVEPSLQWIAGSDQATGLDEVSVATQNGDWGAAVEARPGACFYLHLTSDGATYYGVGTSCTGQEALQATDPRW
jgi:hypothetical protein